MLEGQRPSSRGIRADGSFSRTSGALGVMGVNGPVVAPPATFLCPSGTGSHVIRKATFFCPSGTGSHVIRTATFL